MEPNIQQILSLHYCVLTVEGPYYTISYWSGNQSRKVTTFGNCCHSTNFRVSQIRQKTERCFGEKLAAIELVGKQKMANVHYVHLPIPSLSLSKTFSLDILSLGSTHSVTRWINYFFRIWPLAAFARVISKFYQILNRP